MRIIRIALVLLFVALVGPGTVGVMASGGAASRLTFRPAGGAPINFSVGAIEFSLEKGDNATPINPNTRFAFGTRRVWAFWPWDDAKNSSRVNYVLRFGSTDVAWGTIETDAKSGRMEAALERLDGLPLDLGLYRLYLDASGGDSGNVREATFEIYDPDAGNHDNGNNNNNNNSNNNSNNNNNNNNSNDNGGGDNGDGDNGGGDNENDNN
jgi:hypothetical protein